MEFTKSSSVGGGIRGQFDQAERRVSLGFISGFALAYLGFYIAVLTPIAITLAIRVQEIDPAGKGSSLGGILGTGALFALFANPLFGQLSDRTRSRFGRRKPWLIGGVIVGTLAQLVIAYASSVMVIAVAWCVAQTAYNAMLAALVAVVPDRVPEHQRGLISALAGMAIYVGLLIGSGVVSVIGTKGHAIFLIPACIGFIAIFVFAVFLRDRSTADDRLEQQSVVDKFASSFWVNPFKHPDFGFAWLSRFLVIFGFAILTSYQVYYLIDHLHVDSAEIGHIMFDSTLITSACVVVGSFVAGYLSDRLGRRKIFVLAAATTYAIGIAVIMLAPGLETFFIGVAVSSLGFGVYMAVDQALVVDVLPDRETSAAKNMGVMNIANAVPQSLAPAIAPVLLSIGSAVSQNYTALYSVAALSAFLGALAVTPVRGVR